MGWYFDSWQLGGHKYAFAGVSAGPIGVRVPSIPHLSALEVRPQNDLVFTKNAPTCTKYTNIAPKGQKCGKIRMHMDFGPPPSPERLEGRY